MSSKGRLTHLGPSLLLVSAVGIAHQIGLMRVLSVAQWHHFAYMIISVAMLGFAASGTALALLRERVAGREEALYRAGALVLVPVLVGTYALAQTIPFETFELATQPVQARHLLLLYLVLSLPFFVVSWCITLAFFLRPRRVGRVYAVNMTGSGLGAAGVVGLLFVVPPAGVPYVLSAAAAVACLLAVLDTPGRRRAGWLAGLLAAGLVVWAIGHVPVQVSQYKGLSYALDFPDADVVTESTSPLSVLTAVRSGQFRETPGQISNYPMATLGELPEQVALFFDAGAVSPIHRFDGDLSRFAFLDYVTTALPYRLVERPRVLVIGAGGGTEVLAALYHEAAQVTAVEVDPGVFPLVRTHFRDFSGRLYERPDVTPVVAEGRGFLAGSRESWDLIQIALLDSFNASAAGVHALSESYLYTVEAVELYLRRLSPDGVLSVTRWLKTPPRDAVKMLATLIEAAERAGIEEPDRHIAFIRSWNTGTLVLSRAPLDEEGIEAVRSFAEERWFDLAWLPGLRAEEANRYTVLEEDVYHEAARALLDRGRRAAFYRDYPFYVRPATDDRPYFFRFFRWRTLPDLLEGLGRQMVSFVEWGYLALVATLGQAILAALALVLLPLLIFARGRRGGGPGARRRTVLFFGALGLAYMFLEIAFIQKLMLFLNYPVYAVAVVLSSFLVFSGLGSYFADRSPMGPRALAVGAVGAIAALAVLYLVGLPPLFEAWGGWSDPARIGAGVALLAPLAFAMGIPFPTGFQVISDHHGPLVPWAWGVNGAASVVGATLAAVTAVHLGFGVVVGLAVLLYAGALLTFPRPATEGRARRP